MAGWQQTIIVGNVGRDPEMRFLQSGPAVASFTVAVTRRWNDRESNERREETTWFRVTCWRKLAETANQYVRKGTQIMVVGTIKASAYTDNSGQPASTLELTADNFQLLGSRQSEGEGGYPSSGDDYSSPGTVGDIPF